MTAPPIRTTLACTAVAAFVLAACQPRDERPKPPPRVTPAVLRVVQTAAESPDPALGMNAGGEVIVDKVKDAGISAAVNAELTRDPALSALRIEVDTVNGRVALRGVAPDTSSRERAASIAMTVAGVIAVDNQLGVLQSMALSKRILFPHVELQGALS